MRCKSYRSNTPRQEPESQPATTKALLPVLEAASGRFIVGADMGFIGEDLAQAETDPRFLPATGLMGTLQEAVVGPFFNPINGRTEDLQAAATVERLHTREVRTQNC